MKSVGTRIKQRRIDLGLSASQLAKLLSLNPSTVTRYETGEIKAFRPETVIELAKHLQCSPSYLMGFESEESTFSPLAKRVASAFDSASPKDQTAICAILSLVPPEQEKILLAAKGGGAKPVEVDAVAMKKVAKNLRSLKPHK